MASFTEILARGRQKQGEVREDNQSWRDGLADYPRDTGSRTEVLGSPRDKRKVLSKKDCKHRTKGQIADGLICSNETSTGCSRKETLHTFRTCEGVETRQKTCWSTQGTFIWR